MKPVFRLLVLGLSLLAGLVPEAGHAAITLRTEAKIARPAVRLSDVFAGLPKGADCDIAQAPQPGSHVVYDVRILNLLAQQHDLDWHPQSLADHATIISTSTVITPDMIADAVADHIKANGVKGDIDVVLDNRDLQINLPGGAAPDFSLGRFEYDPSSRRFRANLAAEGLNGPLNVSLTGRAIIKHSVPVLARRLDAGTTIDASDVDWIEVPEDRINDETITDAKQLIGFELRHVVESDQPLLRHDVIPPRLVKRGSVVLLRVETPLMQVTAQGRALQDGAFGDVVRVNNIQSKRMIEGTVEGPGIVRVGIPQRVAALQPAGKQE